MGIHYGWGRASTLLSENSLIIEGWVYLIMGVLIIPHQSLVWNIGIGVDVCVCVSVCVCVCVSVRSDSSELA